MQDCSVKTLRPHSLDSKQDDRDRPAGTLVQETRSHMVGCGMRHLRASYDSGLLYKCPVTSAPRGHERASRMQLRRAIPERLDNFEAQALWHCRRAQQRGGGPRATMAAGAMNAMNAFWGYVVCTGRWS